MNLLLSDNEDVFFEGLSDGDVVDFEFEPGAGQPHAMAGRVSRNGVNTGHLVMNQLSTEADNGFMRVGYVGRLAMLISGALSLTGLRLDFQSALGWDGSVHGPLTSDLTTQEGRPSAQYGHRFYEEVGGLRYIVRPR